jgi:hypothetical protein
MLAAEMVKEAVKEATRGKSVEAAQHQQLDLRERCGEEATYCHRT